MHAGHGAKQRPRATRRDCGNDRAGGSAGVTAAGTQVPDGGPEGRRGASGALRTETLSPERRWRSRAARPPGPGARRCRGGATGRPGAAPASAVAVETVVAAGRRLESPLLRGASLLAALQLLFIPVQRLLQGGEHRGGSERPCVPAKPLPRCRTVLGGRARPAPGPRAPEFRWFRRVPR